MKSDMRRVKMDRWEQGLIALLTMTYMVSYITRINYNCILVEIEESTNIARDLLSMAVTGSFFSYALGQVVSGIMGDRFSPKRLVLAGLVVTVLMNLVIPICQDPYQFIVIWTINGFAQSFMWPPMVRIMYEFLSEESYKHGSSLVSWGSAFGTIAMYLVSPVIISLANWKAVFIFSAACGVLMIPVWCIRCPDVSEKTMSVQQADKPQQVERFITPLMLCMMATVVLQGMVRDSVTTWMPTFIFETYHLGTGVSIFSGVVLPIFNIICYHFSKTLHMQKLKNPVSCATVFFCIGTISAALLLPFKGIGAGVSVLLLSLLAGCMQGISLMMVSMVPPYYKNVSTVSGVLNACTYAGSAVSTYVVAVISKNTGWNSVIFLWAVAALCGTIICAISIKSFRSRHF